MGKRRGNQEGSIYQRTSDGLWVASLSLPNGKRKAYYGKTQKEARDKLKAALREQDRGLDLSAKAVTVRDFLTLWLEDTARPTIRLKTYESYRGMVHNHLVPGLGHHKLAQLTPLHVQALMNEKRAAGLSPRTVGYVRAVLRRALVHALRCGLVTRNVATLVDPPKMSRTPVHPLTPDQVRRLLDATKDDRLGPLFHVAIATGLRQGELFGLRWEDVDLDAGTLTVRYALQRVKHDGGRVEAMLTAPKTTKSRRTIYLPASAIAALRTQRVRQLEARLLAGDRWQGEQFGLVFTSTIGTPLNHANVTHHLQRVLAEAGLPRQRFHDLRHGCATLLLAQGVPLKTIQEVLGHSQITLTADTYAHLAPAMKRDAADQLEAILAGTS
jgi:integrase